MTVEETSHAESSQGHPLSCYQPRTVYRIFRSPVWVPGHHGRLVWHFRTLPFEPTKSKIIPIFRWNRNRRVVFHEVCGLGGGINHWGSFLQVFDSEEAPTDLLLWSRGGGVWEYNGLMHDGQLRGRSYGA